MVIYATEKKGITAHTKTVYIGYKYISAVSSSKEKASTSKLGVT